MGAKKKTTFAKLNRENKLRERQAMKQMRKDERKREGTAEGEGGPQIGEPHMQVEVDEEELAAALRAV